MRLKRLNYLLMSLRLHMLLQLFPLTENYSIKLTIRSMKHGITKESLMSMSVINTSDTHWVHQDRVRFKKPKNCVVNALSLSILNIISNILLIYICREML